MSAARRKLGWVGAMALVATAVVATPSAAAPGDLDAGFGSGGIRGGVPGQPESVAEAPDGKVVTVSSVYTGGPDTIHVRRFTAAGAPDSSFSGGGALTLTTGTGPRPQVYVDPAGRIVVASASSSGFQVWRFEADGDLDPTFSGDGTVPLSVTTAGFAQIGGIGRQPDGDLVIQVNDSFPIGGIAQRPKLVRVTDAGVEAQTVEVLADFTESNAGSLAATALDATGRSYVLLPDDGRLIVRRYTAALALDATYSGDGIIAVTRPGGAADNENWGGAISVSDDGSALVTGTVGTYTPNGALPPTVVQQATLLARLTSAGTLDTGFSGDGLVALARPSGSISPDTVDQAASGGAVVVASRSDGDSSTVVWQIRAGGDPETGFSGDGRLERSAYGKTARVVQSGARLLLFESAASQSQLAALQLVAPAPVAGSVYVPITPCRVLDTRSGGGALTNANARPVQVGGTGAGFAAQGGKPGGCGVPDGASAVAASITAVTPTANGFLRAWPTGVAEPGATFLNFTKAQNTTNTGAITLAATGTNDLTVKAAGATVHVVIDVQGYFVAPGAVPVGAAGSVYVPITPCRVVDTRSGGGALTNANARPVQVGGTGAGFAAQGGKPGGCGVPDGASAVAASITAVTPTANGFLRAWPTGVAEPGATFLNFTKAQNTTNTGAITLAATGTNDLTVKAAGATVHVVIDVQGYFVAPPT